MKTYHYIQSHWGIVIKTSREEYRATIKAIQKMGIPYKERIKTYNNITTKILWQEMTT